MTPIAPHVTAFFQKRLAVELRASRHTCGTYAYAFQLLFEFMSRKLGVAPADLALEALDAPLMLEFLEHLQKERQNSARTRNARLAVSRFHIGLTIATGLGIGTLFTLFVLPAFYLLLARDHAKEARKRGDEQAAEPA